MLQHAFQLEIFWLPGKTLSFRNKMLIISQLFYMTRRKRISTFSTAKMLAI